MYCVCVFFLFYCQHIFDNYINHNFLRLGNNRGLPKQQNSNLRTVWIV